MEDLINWKPIETEYTAIVRTKRGYNFQSDFFSVDEFDKKIAIDEPDIEWATLLRCSDGSVVKQWLNNINDKKE